MQVIGVQHDIEWENKEATFERVTRLLANVSPRPQGLIVLPEMFATGFSMNLARVAEDAAGLTERFLAGLARTHSAYVVAGVAVRGKDGKYRNKALVFGPDGALLTYYAKMRLFSPGSEGKHMEPGQRVVTFQANTWNVSTFVCYDLRFPELFRHAMSNGRPELFLVVANWPEKRAHHWRRLLQARAIENQAYVVGINRVGSDPFYVYSGGSLIVDPQGEVVAEGGSSEALVTAELDLDNVHSYRKGLPFLEDFRPMQLGG